MNVNKLIGPIILSIWVLSKVAAQKQTDYSNYHRDIISAEQLITREKYSDALLIFKKVFASYEFIFLRDYKIASQLAFFIKDDEKAFDYIRLGISDGWTLEEITKNKFLIPLQKKLEWEIIKKQYDSLRNKYNERINQKLRAEVQQMFKKDQRLDFPYYLRIGEKAKERYALRKFAPNSGKQIARLNEILDEYGYPGERLIGNDFWMSTILVHHNSISPQYSQADTLYPSLKPRLLKAIEKGEMAPDDYAIIEDWDIVTKSNHTKAAYGYLNSLTEQELPQSDSLRKNIGMCSIETRNHLVDIQKKTGINFYLDGTQWVPGKITVTNKR